ncbi:MFS transporter [Micromonospora globispora]|nr:MFS transporter [Micromonospora globispora]
MSYAVSTRRRSLVLVLGFLLFLIDGYDLFVLGTVGPSLLAYQPWGATPATLGLLGSVTALGMPFGAIAAGWASDVWGRRLPLTVCLSWVSLFMLLSAFAPSLGMFVATRAATGIGLGALVPVGVALVADAAPPRRHSLFVGVALTGIAVGGFVTALVGRALLPHMHFQRLFLVGALALLLIPLVRALVGRELPQADRQAAAAPLAGRNKAAQLFQSGFGPASMLFWVATFIALLLSYGAGTWLPTLMVKAGYDLSSALSFSMTFTLGAIVGTVVVTLIADRGFLKATTLGCFLLAAVAMLVLSTPQPRWLLLAMSALAGVGTLGTQNLINAYVAQFYPARLRSTALGFSLGVGRIGAIAGPSYIAAITILITVPKAGFYAFIVPAVIGALVIAVVPARSRSSATTRPVEVPA